MSNFSDRLKSLRKEKNLTLAELGKDVGLTNATISRYESGARKPSQDILEILADYFEVTTDYLLGRTNQKYFRADETISFHSKGKLSDEDMKMVRNLIDRLVKDHKEEKKKD